MTITINGKTIELQELTYTELGQHLKKEYERSEKYKGQELSDNLDHYWEDIFYTEPGLVLESEDYKLYIKNVEIGQNEFTEIYELEEEINGQIIPTYYIQKGGN